MWAHGGCESADSGTDSAAAGVAAGGEGVLLYYAYRDLRSCQAEVRDWMEALCRELGLVGRVRVALDGLNATLGGSMAALRQHAAVVQERFGDLAAGPPIDFKLAVNRGRKNDAAVAGSKFDRLTVAACKEVVSMSPLGGLAGAATDQGASGLDAAQGVLPAGARHVEPAEFHAMLAEAAAGRRDAGGKPTVLIDARNYYETRIGRFDAARVELLDPEVRCFSDTPAWLEANQHRLANRRIMMYCTGGVRCERASAYVKSLGSSFQDVVQLKGGIQRYLEAFPDGGFFKGKNFVFDERVDVEGGSGDVVGTCIACGGPWDDYRHRRRCPCCRMLVLMCDACAAALPEPSQGCVQADAGAGGAQQQQQQQLVRHPVCDLCQRRQQQAKRGAAAGSSSAGRLRILCLHGFRQSARNFEGRTHALRRRLKDLAEFVFIDAPHQLPAWTKPGAGEEAAPEGSASVCGNAATTAQAAAAQAAAQEQQDPVPASAQPRAEPAAALEQQALEAAEGGRLHRLPREVGQRQGQRGWPPRRAWMLVPEQYAALRAGQQHQEGYEQQHQEGEEQQLQQQQAQTQERRQLRDEAPPAAVPASYVDEWQLQRQTDGWQESWLVLEAALREQGPFDGVMGFSQGAAVAAVLAAQVAAERQRQRQQVAEGCVGAGSADGASLPQPMLRFAILCSGYISPVEEHGRLLQAAATMGGAALPTLHIYGSGGDDRQVGTEESARLAECFDPVQRFVMRHSSGHIIPSNKTALHRIREFLLHVQQQEHQLRVQQ